MPQLTSLTGSVGKEAHSYMPGLPILHGALHISRHGIDEAVAGPQPSDSPFQSETANELDTKLALPSSQIDSAKAGFCKGLFGILNKKETRAEAATVSTL